MIALGGRAAGTIAVLTIILAGGAHCAQSHSPFVAGFDRFAGRGQIAQELAGRLLLTELSCTACHKSNNALLQPKVGPRLTGIGDRIQSDWLRQFLARPHTVKPGTTMPDLLAGMSADEQTHAVNALVALLSTQHEPFAQLKASGANPLPHEFWRQGNAATGQKLYHQVGCVACHEPDNQYEVAQPDRSPLDRLLEQLDPEEIEEMRLPGLAPPVRSVPLGNLAAKYSPKSLTFFLLNPESIRPSGRMPGLKLSPVEAADITAYLLREQNTSVAIEYADAGQALVKEGQRLFGKLGCANCHALDRPLPQRKAKPLSALRVRAANTCLGEPPPGVPHFGLEQAQTRAIISAALSREVSPTSKARVSFHMLQLNCYACHERGELGGVGRNRRRYFETAGHVDLGDEGQLPPSLSSVGGKLQQSWLAKVLAGNGDLRSHMSVRMPSYPGDSVASLPTLFVQADANKRLSEQEVFGDRDKQAEAGRMLLDAGCVQCHAVRGESLPGVVGVDLAGISSRMRPNWFREFLLDPESLKPGTRMPTFFPDGRSSNPDILGGQADDQIASMWAYLKEIDKHPLPPKLVQARSRDFELMPGERPIVLRTFMEQAGTHAIAVGFPQGVHIAFDAENVRLAQAWRGRFLDAYGTWFVRLAPPAKPLGEDQIVLPPGMPLALLADKRQAWPATSAEAAGYQFLGYRFDQSGVPTFLYRLIQWDIEDRIEPNARRGLSRRIRIKQVESASPVQKTLWLRANVGKTLQQTRPDSYTNGDGLTSVVPESAAQSGVVRQVDGLFEWLVPLTVDPETTIELEYQW